MSRKSVQVFDDYGRPVKGAQVFVTDAQTGSAATLTDQYGFERQQPLITDEFGAAEYYATNGLYDHEIRYAGRVRYREMNVAVGSVVSLFKGDKGDPGGPLANGNYGDVVVSDFGATMSVPVLSWITAGRVRPGTSGVVGNGTASDGAAIVAISNALPANAPLVLLSGSYRIDSNITFSRPVHFLGGRLLIANGVNVTFNGGLFALPEQIFECSGTGKVVISSRKTPMGYAEWWGAKADQTMDCLPALNAAHQALLWVQLLGGDYLISGTFKMNLGNRRVAGVGCRYVDTDAEVTRILCSDATVPIIQHGPDNQPANINAMPQGIVLENVYLGRNVAPTIASNCEGLRCRWSLHSSLKNVKAADSMVGIRYNGTVHLKVENCEAARAQAGSGAGADYFVGHYADGSGNIGAAGGNASLYLIKCVANCNLESLSTAPGSVGFKADGAFTDLFIEDPETTNFQLGLTVTGNEATGNTFSNTDCRIVHPIMDQFRHAGIYVTDIAEAGSVEIVDPYCGPNASARACIWVNSSVGAVRVSGGQLVLGGAPGCQPVLVEASDNVDVAGTIILEAGPTYPAVGLVNASNCRITPRLRNSAVTAAAAVQLSGTCSANLIAPVASGKANAYTLGIQVVGTADSRNEYGLTGIDSSCITGGGANKLTRNGVQITATGLSETNLVSGVTT